MDRAAAAAPEIRAVDTGTVDRTRDLAWLADRQLLLLAAGRAASRRSAGCRATGCARAMAGRRELLALPSPEIADLVRNDPLGLFDLLRADLGGAQAGVNLGVTEGGYVTPRWHAAGSSSRDPARPPFDTAFSQRAVRSARAASASERGAPPPAPTPRTKPRPPLQVEFAGGHRIAVETEARGQAREHLEHDRIARADPAAAVRGLPQRRGWSRSAPLPSALALAIVLGALGLTGATLSAAATASAAMLFGLGIDGVVLLYVAYTRFAASGGAADGRRSAV